MRNRWRISAVSIILLLALGKANTLPSDAHDYFKIVVVDAETGRGVPLVELKTSSNVRYYTDSNGIVAFYEPGLMERDVFFSVKSHGYEFTERFFDEAGKVLKVTRGGSAVLKIKRLNVAERLYRITGEGIYRDSVMVGQPVPVKQPLLNGKVMGQDSVMVAPYRGKLYWFWGDTPGPANFNGATSGATSELPGTGGLDPSLGVDLAYFVNESGFSREMCPLTGRGLVWMDWVLTVKDDKGTERLVAGYSRIKDLDEAFERVVGIFNDQTEKFEPIAKLNVSLREPHLVAHPFRAEVAGQEYFYFAGRSLFTRIRAELKQLTNPLAHESFTPLVAGSKYQKAASKFDRTSDGRLLYGWKAGTDPINFERQQELIAAGKMKAGEALWQLRDIDTGEIIGAPPGSVFWNEFRRRWVMLVERFGQAWYAEGDTFVGPWVYAKKIVAHDRYSFYNIKHHPFFDQEGGRLIYFEGTYTDAFANPTDITPRYNYNQIMYRLALDDAQLFLPTPVYHLKSANGEERYLFREDVEAQNLWEKVEEIPFFALPPNRRREGVIPVFAENGRGQPLFEALPFNSDEQLTGTWRCKAHDSGGAEFPFVLELKLNGADVSGGSSQDSLTIVDGKFKEGRLELKLKNEQTVYVLSAALKQGKLAGKWKQQDTGEAGTWEGARTDFISQQVKSSTAVPLYEYRNVENGARFYSTNPNLGNKTIKRTVQPLCRVWRNPMSSLILDPQTKPVSVERK